LPAAVRRLADLRQPGRARGRQVEADARCRRHDTDDGRPAIACYRSDWTVKSEEHYRNGWRHDTDDGRPAVVNYRSDWTVKSEEHYRNGRRHDTDDGRPAVVNYRPDGDSRERGALQRRSGQRP